MLYDMPFAGVFIFETSFQIPFKGARSKRSSIASCPALVPKVPACVIGNLPLHTIQGHCGLYHARHNSLNSPT